MMEVVESSIESSFVFLISGERVLRESFFEHFEVIVHKSHEPLMLSELGLRLDFLMSFIRNGADIEYVMFIHLNRIAEIKQLLSVCGELGDVLVLSFPKFA